MQNKKPLGLVLIAIYCAIWGTAMIPLGCMSSMASAVPGVPAYAGPLGMAILAFGVAMIAGAYGIWTVQPWGRTYNIWLELATVPINLLTLVGLMPGGKVTTGDRITSIICLVLTVVIVKYLTSDGIKRFFGQDSTDSWAPAEPRL
jgi:hypothetical protein